ncbi:DUF973 family protein [Metallosphaera sedula]|uniref:DUF973 family protein n=1 Tax=Metallosphaera sedula TaxID=43687 RepID=UPI0020BF9066|nr:DUF973 family protein [Metallosphaera sedula]BBL46982.1 hypothetical protein MJ1HA_1083 [Metallosphaera sedula]
MASPQEVNGISRLRGGIAFEFLAAILLILGIVFFAGGIAGVIVGVIILVLAIAVAIIALVRLYGGFSALEPFVPNMVLGRIGVILSIIPYLNFIGYILIGIALYFIGERYNNGTLKTGGIITAIPFINFIGLIISYIGLGSINFSAVPQPSYQPGYGQGPGYQPGYGQGTGVGQGYGPSQQGQPVSVYQVGQGTLKYNTANFTLYSSGQVRITGASLEGVDTYAVSINPMLLSPGNNNVSINFSSLPQTMIPGGVYRIKVNLDNNTSVYVSVIYSQQ